LVILTIWRLGFAPSGGNLHEFGGPTMGTTYSVKVVDAELTREGEDQIARAIEAALTRVNGLMSTWDPHSELSRFNRSASTDPFPVAPETLRVFRVAREVSDLTGGAFDVTVGPLVVAWGFGSMDRVPAEPPPAELAALRERVGYRRVEIDESGSLSKRHPETECDLSAIAKGYGVDEVAGALVELGQHDFLVEVGGELRAMGVRGPDRPWRVAIERPEVAARSLFGVVELRNISMATSGDYRNYFEQDGVRLSHLIDPRTGRPIAHALASVTVLHADAVYADALATGLSVLGPEAGPTLAEEKGLAAYFIVREREGNLRGVATSKFPPVERAE
jgi:thiamine biosynthesis lipoprotein